MPSSSFIKELVLQPGYKRFTRFLWKLVVVILPVSLILKYAFGYISLMPIAFGLPAVLFYFKIFEPVASEPWDEKYNMEGEEVPMEVQRMQEDMAQVQERGSMFQKLAVSMGFRNFIHSLVCMSMAIVCIAILFVLNHWPGGDSMLIIAGGGSIVSLLLTVVCYMSLPITWKGHKELLGF